MQVVVIATVETQKEFQEKGVPEGIEVHFETALANAKTDADVYFYLLPEETLEMDLAALEVLKKPVYVNGVITTLDKLPGTFIRINAWPGFLERSLIEVAADEDGAALTKSIFHKLDWNFQLVPDVPGMISARVVSMIVNEAYFALEDEVSTKEEIDIAMKLGTNYPFGPFEWSRKIGLGNIHSLLSHLSKTDPRYTPCSLLVEELNS